MCIELPLSLVGRLLYGHESVHRRDVGHLCGGGRYFSLDLFCVAVFF